MSAPNVPKNRNRIVWGLLAAILLLWLFGAALFFGTGQKIWLPPSNVTMSGPSTTRPPILPLFCVAAEAEAKALVGRYGVGTRTGFGPLIDRDDFRGHITELSYAENNGRYVVSGELWCGLRPYRGFPGNVLRIASTPEEILMGFDKFLHKNYPNMKYEWLPEPKDELEKQLAPYRWPRDEKR